MERLSPEQERELREKLAAVGGHFDSAVEFWTVVCLSREELGDPTAFVETGWNHLLESIQDLRVFLSRNDLMSSIIQEQWQKLHSACTELREIFDVLTIAKTAPTDKLEWAVTRLAALWKDAQLRTRFMGHLTLQTPTPPTPAEKLAYYTSILDGLFDRFDTMRAGGDTV